MKNLFVFIFAVVLAVGAGAQSATVTFNVNMSEQTVAESGVYLGGGVMGGHDAYQLTDDDGDGIYSVSLDLAIGTTGNYIFLNGNCSDWSCKEQLGGQPCADPNNWNDRILPEVTGNVQYNICFGICSDDGSCELAIETADITFRVNTQTIEVGSNGMYLGGGDYFGDAMGHAMSDADGDGTYEVVVAVPLGYSGNYVFLNSPNDGGDWGAKEDLAGLECADGTWNDRLLPTVEGEASYSTCFGQCSTDGSCEAPALTSDVTFSVDMSQYESSYGAVNLNGSFNGWCGGCNPMADDDGDLIFEVTLPLNQGDTLEYKFTLDGWNTQENFTEGDACTSTIDGFTNRTLTVSLDNMELSTVCWNSCDACPEQEEEEEEEESTTVDATLRVDMNDYPQTFGYVNLSGSLNGWCGDCNQMSDDDGDGVYEISVSLEGNTTYEYKFTLDNWAVQESFNEGDECTSTINGFTNRSLVLDSDDIDLDAVCFNSCDACTGAAPVSVTFQVDMSEEGANPSGVFIAGGFQGWDAGGSQMTDDDGDLIYKYTQTGIVPNSNIQWKYLNGASFDFEETVPATCNTGTNRFYDVGEEDVVLDVVCFSSCVGCDVEAVEYDVTFNCNTANITVGPNGMYLGGGDYFGDAMGHAMSDDDGDGIYTVTVSVPEGYSGNYIYLNSPNDGGDWGAKEDLAGQECADGTWNDRLLSAVTGPTTVTSCFGECSEACSPPPAVFHDVTFNCNTATITVGPNGMYLGGGDYFGDAMGHAMSDDDGDGIYSVTVAVPDGYSGNYVYLNSPNDGGDWGAKEDLAGQECADGTWNDRLLPPVTEATTLSSCFGQCSTDGSCELPAASVNVTFQVDMSNYTDAYGSVNLNGGFAGWCGGCIAMTDDDGDNVYGVTIELEGDATYEYKFTLDGWNVQENFEEGDACTSTIDGFTNRSLTLGSEDVVLNVVCFNSCEACEDPVILGCTDPFYAEFDMNATEDDGSCSTAVVFGCTYEDATNYNQEATNDDGSCEFELNTCAGDLDGDGLVATPDLLQFLSEFGTTCL